MAKTTSGAVYGFYCVALIALIMLVWYPATLAQSTVMMPEQSEAKARELLRQATDALGGPAYLGVRDQSTSGRISFFGSDGDFSSNEMRDFSKFPDYNRTEFITKGRKVPIPVSILIGGTLAKGGTTIKVFAGDKGWTLDKEGVSEVTAREIAEFRERIKRDVNYLLRFRLKEVGMTFRYGGSEADMTNLTQVDWVEIVDSERRTFRLALDKSTHLLVRSIVTTQNPETRERDEDARDYSNYQKDIASGITAPSQITLVRNGQKIMQLFVSVREYNTQLPDNFFSRESLQERFSKGGKKGTKKH